MKNIILIATISFLVHFNGFGQQQVLLKDVAFINLPKNTEKLTKDQIKALKPNNGKVSPIVHEHFNGESFKGKKLLVQLNAASIVPRPGFLEQRKREMDDLYSLSQPQVYSTSIKRVQNHSVVITNYEYLTEDMGYFVFKSYNNRGDRVIVGTIEYEKGNKEEAEQDLLEMLSSIKFKK